MTNFCSVDNTSCCLFCIKKKRQKVFSRYTCIFFKMKTSYLFVSKYGVDQHRFNSIPIYKVKCFQAKAAQRLEKV
jgi:hypothetical protein